MIWWILLGSILMVSAGCYLFLVGYFLLDRQGYDWRAPYPTMYDAKEPFEQWAVRMERARRIQGREDGD